MKNMDKSYTILNEECEQILHILDTYEHQSCKSAIEEI